MAPPATPPFCIEVITLVAALWPQWLAPGGGLVARAFATGLAQLTVSDLRDFGQGPHRQVDDAPYGGGAGMVLAVPPLHAAIKRAQGRTPGPVILLSPRGQHLDQPLCRALAAQPGMILLCGRYEGLDERVRRYVDADVSLGNFVLSAGDPAALALIDAVVRLRPGVLGNAASLQEESFAPGSGHEYPQYTRPQQFDGQQVPAVLRGGNHRQIATWRHQVARDPLPRWG